MNTQKLILSDHDHKLDQKTSDQGVHFSSRAVCVPTFFTELCCYVLVRCIVIPEVDQHKTWSGCVVNALKHIFAMVVAVFASEMLSEGTGRSDRQTDYQMK